MLGVDGAFGLNVTKSSWSFYTHHSSAQAATPIVPHRRVHLVGVRTLNQKLLYVDGKLVASLDEPIKVSTKLKRSPLRIILYTAGLPYTIDELRITQGTPYTQDFTPPTRFSADKNTLALYHFDEGEATSSKTPPATTITARSSGPSG